jgi:hypothetical protein
VVMTWFVECRVHVWFLPKLFLRSLFDLSRYDNDISEEFVVNTLGR